MLVFVTTVRHPRNCNTGYAAVLALLRKTLSSVSNQSSSEFHIVVVCNERPGPAFSNPKIDFVEVDFRPPSIRRTSRTGLSAYRFDKGTKFVVGLLWSRRYSPTHVMYFDADDFVSNRLAEWVNQHQAKNGWCFTSGYKYVQPTRSLLSSDDDFHMHCGTSHIVPASLYEIPAMLSIASTQKEIVKAFDRKYLENVLGGHLWTKTHCEAVGHPLEPLPFRGSIYHIGHGENHGAKARAVRGMEVEFTRQIEDEFGIFATEEGTIETLDRREPRDRR